MASKFSKQHYIALLDLMAEIDQRQGIDRATIGTIVNQMAEMFSGDNDRFNYQTFYSYWDRVRQ